MFASQWMLMSADRLMLLDHFRYITHMVFAEALKCSAFWYVLFWTVPSAQCILILSVKCVIWKTSTASSEICRALRRQSYKCTQSWQSLVTLSSTCFMLIFQERANNEADCCCDLCCSDMWFHFWEGMCQATARGAAQGLRWCVSYSVIVET